ncbi:MAG: ABC transporter permease [Bradymonadales bacterium]|nr:ABC transporter permease [Bradymonadales bacterium]
MKGFLTRVTAITVKEAAHILRDPRVMIFALVLPVLLLLLFGYAISFDVDHIPLVVVDQDQTNASRNLVESFTSGDLFEIKARRSTVDQVEPLFRSGLARAALVIPEEFTRRLAGGREPSVQLLLDGSDNNTATVALGYAGVVALEVSRRQMPTSLSREGAPISAQIRTFFNPGLRSSAFIVPGLTAVILTMIATMLTALTVSREIEQGSMEQLFTTPVSRLEIVVGKVCPYFLLGLVAVLLVLTAGVAMFSVPVAGSLWLLFGVSALFLLAMFIQGLFISVATRRQALASQLAFITTMLPALLLSGFVFPIDNMPWPLQFLARALPPSYFIHAIRAVLLRGNGVEAILRDSLAILLFFGVFLLLTVRRFRRALN